MSIQSYRDLVVWQKAMDFVYQVYVLTRNWPKDELYGLTNQVRRAVVSIPANVAEGQGRRNPKEFLRFLAIANGSLVEAETHLYIAHRLAYCDQSTLDRLMKQADEIGRLLQGLTKSLRAHVTDT